MKEFFIKIMIYIIYNFITNHENLISIIYLINFYDIIYDHEYIFKSHFNDKFKNKSYDILYINIFNYIN